MRKIYIYISIVNLENSLVKLSNFSLDAVPETATTSSLKNEIPSKNFNCDFIPNLSTNTDNINICKEPMCLMNIVNEVDSAISNDKLDICNKLRA